MKMNVFAMVLCFASFMLVNTASAQITKPGPVSGKPKTTQPKKTITKKAPTSPQLETAQQLPPQAYQELNEIFSMYDDGSDEAAEGIIGDVLGWANDWWNGPDGGTHGPTGGGSGGGIGPEGSACSELGDEIEGLMSSLQRGIDSYNANCGDEITTLADGDLYDCTAHSIGLGGTAMKLGMSLDSACDKISTGVCSIGDLTKDAGVAAEIANHCNQ